MLYWRTYGSVFPRPFSNNTHACLFLQEILYAHKTDGTKPDSL
jgi:hypothetical protein